MITKDKEYTTRDGREVRIYATDGCEGYTIHGAIKVEGEWESETWTKEGFAWSQMAPSEDDLIEKQKEHTVKVAFWEFDDGSIAATPVEEKIDGWLKVKNTLAIKEITFKEGEGL